MQNSPLSAQAAQFLEKLDQPSYRLKQFNNAYYQQYITSFDELTTWSKDLREKLKQELEFSSLAEAKKQTSPDGNTIKVSFSLKRQPQLLTEAVLMRYEDGRNSVCVSCMVGCPVGCSFCATGQMGLLANLTTREIVDQVLYFARQVAEDGQKITNIVYMGMGEPMLNLEAVEGSYDVFTGKELMGMSKRRLTVSTVGYPEQLKKFIDDGYRPQIALSLHAPNQQIREQIMAVAKVFKLDQVMEAIDYYVDKTNKLVTYEYILIDGVNDQEEHARELGRLLKDRLAHVNLIPYNPIPHTKYKRPSQQKVVQFSKILEQAGVSNTIRVTMGDEIKAACGQLSTNNP